MHSRHQSLTLVYRMVLGIAADHHFTNYHKCNFIAFINASQGAIISLVVAFKSNRQWWLLLCPYIDIISLLIAFTSKFLYMVTSFFIYFDITRLGYYIRIYNYTYYTSPLLIFLSYSKVRRFISSSRLLFGFRVLRKHWGRLRNFMPSHIYSRKIREASDREAFFICHLYFDNFSLSFISASPGSLRVLFLFSFWNKDIALIKLSYYDMRYFQSISLMLEATIISIYSFWEALVSTIWLE